MCVNCLCVSACIHETLRITWRARGGDKGEGLRCGCGLPASSLVDCSIGALREEEEEGGGGGGGGRGKDIG